MQITVKSVRIITEGFQKKDPTKPYKLIGVLADDGSVKGTEYATFDLTAQRMGSGSVIEIGEMSGDNPNIKTKEGKLSFQKIVTIVSEVTAPIEQREVQPDPGSPTGQQREAFKKDIDGLKVEYQLKARIMELKNQAIAEQVAFNGAIEVSGHIDQLPQVEQEKYLPLIDAALAWGLAKLTGTDLTEQLKRMPTVGEKPATTKAEEELWPEDNKENKREFKNAGEFFTACQEIGVTKEVVLGILGMTSKSDVSKINFTEAWGIILETKPVKA